MHINKMVMNFDNHLFRCSSLGKIISKSGKLTDGIETHLQEVFIGSLYGVKKEAYGKALEKGIATEEDGFKMLNETLYPKKFIKKVTEPAANDWIKGTPDTVPDIVWDIKNAYTLFTFGKSECTWDYSWQVKGYCMLYGKSAGAVFYCLNNMPDHMISEEERKMFYTRREWISMEDAGYLQACEELRAAHTYDNMPIQDRFKVFPVSFWSEDEETIIRSVNSARKRLNEIAAEHEARVGFNLKLMESASKGEKLSLIA